MSLEAASMFVLCLLASAICAIVYLYLLADLYKLRIKIRDREILSRDLNIQLLESKCSRSGVTRGADGYLVVRVCNDPKKVTLAFVPEGLYILKSWGPDPDTEMEEDTNATMKTLEASFAWLLGEDTE
jgi:hypothetical protein